MGPKMIPLLVSFKHKEKSCEWNYDKYRSINHMISLKDLNGADFCSPIEPRSLEIHDRPIARGRLGSIQEAQQFYKKNLVFNQNLLRKLDNLQKTLTFYQN
jgi:hypothetical protein